jgi:hypothetical protein
MQHKATPGIRNEYRGRSRPPRHAGAIINKGTDEKSARHVGNTPCQVEGSNLGWGAAVAIKTARSPDVIYSNSNSKNAATLFAASQDPSRLVQ